MANPLKFLKQCAEQGIPPSIAFIGEPAIDAGGVTKEFLYILCLSLLENGVLKLSDALPCVAEGLPTESADLEAYRLFGQFLAMLEEINRGRSDPIFTGRLFDDVVFKMLQCELGKGLSEAKKQLAFALYASEKVTLMAPLGAFLKGEEGAEAHARELLGYLDLDEDVATLDAAGLKGLCLAQFEPYRKPVVALATGVSTGSALRTHILAADPAEVSASIQGSPIDPERLAEAMSLQEKPANLTAGEYAVMGQKLAWIQEKIRDESTPIEWLKEFLQAVTGQGVMGVGLTIKVAQGSSPIPGASTCFNKLYIDTTVLTKKKFLENLEHLVKTKGFGNT